MPRFKLRSPRRTTKCWGKNSGLELRDMWWKKKEMWKSKYTAHCRKRIVIKSRDYRAWRTWHHCIVHVIEPVRVNNDRKFLCNQKTKTRADIRMYNRVNWRVRELYSMWSGSEKINNFKTYCDFWRELEERGTFSKASPVNWALLNVMNFNIFYQTSMIQRSNFYEGKSTYTFLLFFLCMLESCLKENNKHHVFFVKFSYF